MAEKMLDVEVACGTLWLEHLSLSEDKIPSSNPVVVISNLV